METAIQHSRAQPIDKKLNWLAEPAWDIPVLSYRYCQHHNFAWRVILGFIQQMCEVQLCLCGQCGNHIHNQGCNLHKPTTCSNQLSWRLFFIKTPGSHLEPQRLNWSFIILLVMIVYKIIWKIDENEILSLTHGSLRLPKWDVSQCVGI